LLCVDNGIAPARSRRAARGRKALAIEQAPAGAIASFSFAEQIEAAFDCPVIPPGFTPQSGGIAGD